MAKENPYRSLCTRLIIPQMKLIPSYNSTNEEHVRAHVPLNYTNLTCCGRFFLSLRDSLVSVMLHKSER
jgi:hypothetical protein